MSSHTNNAAPSSFPKITVITVVYNGISSIEHAIKSVISQSYSNVEYVVVDGGSTDGTIKLIEKYSQKGIDLWASGKDKGIYDAMNKGVKLAGGDVVYFLNADDKFFDNKVLAKVAKVFAEKKVDMVFGDVLFDYPPENQEVRVSRDFSLNELKKGTMPPHQGTFVKRSWLIENPFEITYKSSSDFDWFCRVAKKGITSEKLNEIIAIFTSGGVSSGTVSYKETELVVKKYFGISSYVALVLKHRVFSIVKWILIKTSLVKLWHKFNSKAKIV
ncbi:MAG: glycosyltransferase family 2 protein [archaeon]|jgi:glycosyltransferase involved in cell wall biosynthesis